MPSVKQLKKDINDSIGALIEEIWQKGKRPWHSD